MPAPNLRGLAALLLGVVGCADGGGLTADPAAAVDLGAVLVGDDAQAILQGPRLPERVSLVADPADLTVALVDPDAGLLRATWTPTAPGPLDGTVVALDPTGVELVRWPVTGAARVPALTVHPARLVLGPAGGPKPVVWAWAEGDRPVTAELVGGASAWSPDPRASRDGLPARFVVPADASTPFTAVRLRTCAHPACAVDVPLEAAGADCGPLVFEAAPVGEPSSRRLTCAGGFGADVTVTHPELTVESVEGGTVTIGWRPAEPGPLQAELRHGGARVEIVGYAVEAPACAARVPEILAFGPVGLGGWRDAELWTENGGDAPCLLSGVDVDGPGFSAPAAAPAWIAPGEAHVTTVRFTPAEIGPADGEAWPRVPGGAPPVPLAADGVDAELVLLTPEIDVGRIQNCPSPVGPILVANEGGADGTVEVVERPEALDLDASPRRVAPGEVLALTPSATYDDGAPGPFDARLVLRLTSARASRMVEVRVLGEIGPLTYVADTFQQLGRPKVDVLFVVDDGAQMSAWTSTLAANVRSFAQFTRAQALSAYAAVTRTSMRDPALLARGDRVVLSSTASETFEDDLVALAVAAASTDSATTSQGLAAAVRALTSTTANRPAGWPRPDAVLSVIFVSARNDVSPGEVDRYVNELLLIKGYRNTNLFSASAVVGPLPDGCVQGDFVAEAGGRYIEVASRTGGVFQSVCDDDWSRRLEDLSTVAFGFKSRFFLTHQPIEATLEVEVDGEIVPRRDAEGQLLWRYDFATNSINFSPFAVPEPGVSITVRYAPECL